LRADQRRRQRDSVIARSRQPGRAGVEALAVAIREGIEANGVGRCKPAALNRRLLQHARVVPDTGAQQLHIADASCRNRICRAGHLGRQIRNQQRIDARELRGQRFGGIARFARRITLDRTLCEPKPSHLLLEFCRDDIAERAFGQQCCEGFLAAAGGIAEDTRDICLRRETQQIDSGLRHAGVAGKRDHRTTGRLGEHRRLLHGLRGERTEDQFRTFRQRLLHSFARGIGIATVVLDQHGDFRVVEFAHGEFRRIADGTRCGTNAAGSRKGQDECHPHRTAADDIARRGCTGLWCWLRPAGQGIKAGTTAARRSEHGHAGAAGEGQQLAAIEGQSGVRVCHGLFHGRTLARQSLTEIN
jgi:hypothetical protein